MEVNLFDFTDENFKSEVLQSDKPVLVDFWAEWCGPCKQLTPIMKELSIEYIDKAKIGKVNVDFNQEIAVKYGIRSIPSLLLFVDGKIEEQIVGAVPKNQITEVINKFVK